MPRLVVLKVLFVAFSLLSGTAFADQLVPETREEIRLSFAPVVERTGPAVVNVYSERVVENRVSRFFEDLLSRQFGNGRGFGGMPRERVQNSLGSGVIVSPEGIIVTNYHVIKGGTDIVVVLADRRSFGAEIVLEDEKTDLAILKIDSGGEDLPWLELGNSDNLQVGDLVLAIGNPFGVGQTVTSGIVSALARTQVGIADYQFFIQTDAAINPGNSGGALIDVSGRVVGINTAIYSRSGGSHGIGFAIPSNMVRLVVNSAEEGERVIRPWVGARFQEVTPDIAEAQGLSRPHGSLVVTLHPQSPLAVAGIEQGDIIMSVNGHEVATPGEVTYRMATLGIGGTATLELLRGEDEYSTEVELVPAPEDPPRDVSLLEGRHPFSGAVVANLSPALSEELGISGELTGVIVVEVRRGRARRHGLRPGDIVLRVEGEEIETVSDLKSAVRRERRNWDVTIRRGERVYNSNVRG